MSSSTQSRASQIPIQKPPVMKIKPKPKKYSKTNSKPKNKNTRKSTKKSSAKSTMTLAEIDRILDERGNSNHSVKSKAKHQYLCSWMDGADPQWVDAKYLSNTYALEEWNDAETEVPEQRDPDHLIIEKCKRFAQMLASAKRPTFMLGAGVSASQLPTFRGKHGLWTKYAHRNRLADATAAKANPTKAHRALVVLENYGKVHWVVTQNYDDLSARSGFPTQKLSELHGNIFTETCDDCLKVFHRDFEVVKDDSVDHETGRLCEQCNGVLRDNIVHFDEDLPWHHLKMANCKFLGSDLTVVLGSSLKVEPAASMPFKAKRRSKVLNTKTVIVNLQPTPRDAEADLVIRATCDEVMDCVAKILIAKDWDTGQK